MNAVEREEERKAGASPGRAGLPASGGVRLPLLLVLILVPALAVTLDAVSRLAPFHRRSERRLPVIDVRSPLPPPAGPGELRPSPGRPQNGSGARGGVRDRDAVRPTAKPPAMEPTPTRTSSRRRGASPSPAAAPRNGLTAPAAPGQPGDDDADERDDPDRPDDDPDDSDDPEQRDDERERDDDDSERGEGDGEQGGD